MEARLRVVRRRAFLILGLALVATGPVTGFWFLIPLAFGLAAFAVADRRMAASADPARTIALGWGIAPPLIAGCAAVGGDPADFALAWLALPAVTLGARFETRGVVIGVAYIIACLLVVTIGLDTKDALAEPQHVIAPLALIIAVALLSSAVGESEREHRQGAIVDPLTGLLNRAAFAQRIAELTALARRTPDPAPVGFLIADIDHFKRVNDAHGHQAGDAVLKDVAYALRQTLRAFDLVYRIGGEEFVVLLPGADADASVVLAEQLRTAVAEASRATPVTMSFGVAVAESRDLDFDGVFAAADRALYDAKRAGRDRVCVAGAAPAAPVLA